MLRQFTNDSAIAVTRFKHGTGAGNTSRLKIDNCPDLFKKLIRSLFHPLHLLGVGPVIRGPAQAIVDLGGGLDRPSSGA